MLDAWEARRPQDLGPLVEKFIHQMRHSYTGALKGRNKAWLPKLLKLLHVGKPTVVTVGVLHMVGPGSLPELLARQGFKCELG